MLSATPLEEGARRGDGSEAVGSGLRLFPPWRLERRLPSVPVDSGSERVGRVLARGLFFWSSVAIWSSVTSPGCCFFPLEWLGVDRKGYWGPRLRSYAGHTFVGSNRAPQLTVFNCLRRCHARAGWRSEER